ncbi:cyclase family protein [Gordonia sp. (in: high G+C Gram-positive bacteria)]|uniref:cyclase family protein n=1 Tax=Gordonia sp. (in: high G+C Gram-positive bacteria) TaxID=84139 RepID=UPI003F95AECD
MQLIDLSHQIKDGTVTYPGLPGPMIGQHLSFEESADHYAPGTEFAIGTVTMVANTGTYLDTPAHRFRGGRDLSDLPLERCALLPALVIDAGPGPIEQSALREIDGISGCAVLLRTGWARHWGTDFYGDGSHPHLTEDAAEYLVAEGAELVGIDSVNIDDTVGGHRPAHTVLLAAEIPVVEHLTNLDRLPAIGAKFTAAPPAIRGLATFPVRAFASVE